MKTKLIPAAIAAFGLCAIPATPAISQDAGNSAAVVFHGDQCTVLIFQPGGPPIFLQGDVAHTVSTNSKNLDVGNNMFSCRGRTDAAASTTKDAINCGVSTFDPSTGTISFWEGRGELQITKSGRFAQDCHTVGQIEPDVFSFITAP